MDKTQLVQFILDKTAHDNGCTVDIHGAEPIVGWAVALKGHEAIYPVIDAKTVRAFLAKNEKILRLEGHYVGTWSDESKVYLDVVQIVMETAEAIAIGHLNDQKAIYNMATKKTISIPLAWEIIRDAVGQFN